MYFRLFAVLIVLFVLAAPHVRADSDATRFIDPTCEQQLELLRQTDDEAMKVLRFWFEEWDDDMKHGGKGKYNNKWFPHGPMGVEGSKEVDRAIRDQFLTTFEAVVSGERQWDIENNAYENLAYVILIDQFARNMFRGTEKSYEHDPKARAAVRINIEKQLYRYYFTGYQKLFIVYPLMHHENMESQQQSLLYLKAINEDETHRYEFLNALQKGVEHYQVIFMFGRFPHRNVRQERSDTELEAAYLEKKGTQGFVDGSKW